VEGSHIYLETHCRNWEGFSPDPSLAGWAMYKTVEVPAS
jgi:hypothetical protein